MNIVKIGLFFNFKNYEKYNYFIKKNNTISTRFEGIFESLNKIIFKYDFKIFRITFRNNKIIFLIANNLNGCLLMQNPFYNRYDEPFKYIKEVEFFYNMSSKEYRIYLCDSEFIPKKNKIIFDKINKIILKALYYSQADKYILV